jgi:hypothetical protein
MVRLGWDGSGAHDGLTIAGATGPMWMVWPRVPAGPGEHEGAAEGPRHDDLGGGRGVVDHGVHEPL